MVTDEILDGTRIGRLFSSEVHGHERGALGRLGVTEADPDVEAAEGGAFAFAVALDDGGDGDAGDLTGVERRIAEAYVHPDRLRIEFLVEAKTAAEAGATAGLRVRPKAVEPPRTLVFVERAADAKAGLRVVRDVAKAVLDDVG
ncbi:uncharacterized protein Nmlp_3153 [Natronomonas moolapensis 8.8.11]|uniref:DUF7993 domain-containing protein n=1 Tax=Natronomonas moolapensis (strain DSM 18674 / CECT 7526 / JCM 14361 / 8.8.11) TaxID=268739 RepID=M1XSE5_NATM8|nr:hypothetical protein [Natronomonas moolapensis]CCQ37291.1 uncharacterized protein Nmlp_3153 [Natronomonas moolapensis 8.8.11]